MAQVHEEAEEQYLVGEEEGRSLEEFCRRRSRELAGDQREELGGILDTLLLLVAEYACAPLHQVLHLHPGFQKVITAGQI